MPQPVENSSGSPYYSRLLFLIVILQRIIMGIYIFSSGIGLLPDEAQYWTWSKNLSFGFYSKPPGIAWQIALGTALFDDTVFGVRFSALVLSACVIAAIYTLVKRVYQSQQAAFYGALLFALSPLGFLASFVATTDCGFILFWVLSCGLLVQGNRWQQTSFWFEVGSRIALGALFKWAIYLLWIPIIFHTLIEKRGRLSKIACGIGVSLLGLLPSLWWSAQHEWATFKHVWTSVEGHEGASWAGNPLEFIGAQCMLLSPVLFVLLLINLRRILKSYRSQTHAIRFCVVTTLSVFFIVLMQSFLNRVQGNWAVACYPTAMALLAYPETFSTQFRKWLKIGLIVSITQVAAVLALPVLVDRKAQIVSALPYKLIPFKQGLGWEKFAVELIAKGYDPYHHFLFSDRYQTTSWLYFYGPMQQRSYCLNIHKLRHNQFFYWPSMSMERVYQTGFYLGLLEGDHALDVVNDVKEIWKGQLKTYFDEVEALTPSVLLSQGEKPVKIALFFRCKGYNGQVPEELNKF